MHHTTTFRSIAAAVALLAGGVGATMVVGHGWAHAASSTQYHAVHDGAEFERLAPMALGAGTSAHWESSEAEGDHVHIEPVAVRSGRWSIDSPANVSARGMDAPCAAANLPPPMSRSFSVRDSRSVGPPPRLRAPPIV
ncbi:MAG: hypothetical protein ACYC5V_14890 [Gemmatimonadaceae bacterium]